MEENCAELWFKWFYKNWEKYSPGELIELGLNPTQIAERFVDEHQDYLLKFSNKFDDNNYDALIEFMKLSETELHILKYFLKLIKQKKTK